MSDRTTPNGRIITAHALISLLRLNLTALKLIPHHTIIILMQSYFYNIKTGSLSVNNGFAIITITQGRNAKLQSQVQVLGGK